MRDALVHNDGPYISLLGIEMGKANMSTERFVPRLRISLDHVGQSERAETEPVKFWFAAVLQIATGKNVAHLCKTSAISSSFNTFMASPLRLYPISPSGGTKKGKFKTQIQAYIFFSRRFRLVDKMCCFFFKANHWEDR